MEDFIIFKDVYNKENAVRKSAIISIYEDEDKDGVVCITTINSGFETREPFNSIIYKL